MCERSSSKRGLRLVPASATSSEADAGPAVGVDDGELDLVVVGVEVEEQLVDLVDDLGDAGVGPVDLVDHEDDGQPGLERLAQDEPGLGLGALGRVDQEEHAVDHGQGPLHLAAEVGVAGRVDDVELHVAVPDRGVLGQDGDALLPLQVVGVEDALAHVLVLSEDAGLPEHGVDQRGLAVVDVGDDGDVPEILPRGHEGKAFRKLGWCRLAAYTGRTANHSTASARRRTTGGFQSAKSDGEPLAALVGDVDRVARRGRRIVAGEGREAVAAVVPHQRGGRVGRGRGRPGPGPRRRGGGSGGRWWRSSTPGSR